MSKAGGVGSRCHCSLTYIVVDYDHVPKYFSFNGVSLYKIKESFLKKKE